MADDEDRAAGEMVDADDVDRCSFGLDGGEFGRFDNNVLLASFAAAVASKPSNLAGLNGISRPLSDRRRFSPDCDCPPIIDVGKFNPLKYNGLNRPTAAAAAAAAMYALEFCGENTCPPPPVGPNDDTGAAAVVVGVAVRDCDVGELLSLAKCDGVPGNDACKLDDFWAPMPELFNDVGAMDDGGGGGTGLGCFCCNTAAACR